MYQVALWVALAIAGNQEHHLMSSAALLWESLCHWDPVVSCCRPGI